MENLGFIHTMMDVKVLILFVMSRVQYPVDVQKLYELCYQDDCLSYFDVREAVPQLIGTGHLSEARDGTLAITDKGRETGEVVEDSLAFPVAQRAQQAVERFNQEIKRSMHIRAEVMERPEGDFSVVMGLDDDRGSLMTLELMAPTRQQARRLSAAFSESAEALYQTVMTLLLEEAEANHPQTP